MKHRIFSMLLAVLMMFTTVDISAFAQQGEVSTEVDIIGVETGTEEETEVETTFVEETVSGIAIILNEGKKEDKYNVSGITLIWPVPNHTSLNDNRFSSSHNGIDITDGNINGAQIVASIGGRVLRKFTCPDQHYGSYGDCNGFGTGLWIAGDDGRYYQYAHMQAYSIPSGIEINSRVEAGQVIGRVGTTGYSSGPHLHFGISLNEPWGPGVDPMNETYSYTSAPAENASFPLQDGQYYYIKNRNAGRILGSESTAEGSKIILTDKQTGNASQMWKAVKHADGYSFISSATGYAMDVYGYSTENLAEIMQFAYHGNTNQRFKLIDRGEGYYSIHPICSGLGLDAYEASTAAGTKIVQYGYHGGYNMQWSFEPVDEVKPIIHNAYIYHYDANSFTVVVSASDNVGIAKVEFPTWYESQEISPVNWYKGNLNQNDGSYWYTVNVSDYGSKEGTYYTHVYVWDHAGNAGVYNLSQYIDRTPPTVTEKKAERISDDTVKISCKVSDNTGVVSVYFPTWSDYNGQDDLQSDWETHYKGTKEGDWWVFFVRDYDHNYEKGSFTTHIYPYDAYNNHSSSGLIYSFANQYKPYSFTHGEHSYELYNDLLTWEEAKAKCEELGGHLVTINSQEEQIAIEEALRKGVRGNYYLGGKTEKNQYVWITGEAFTYSNWAVNEPNNYVGEQGYYVIKKSTNKWDDVNKLQKYGFICEYEPDAVIPTDKPDGTIPNGFWIAGVDETGYTYTGSAIKPQVRVYDKNKRLELNKDYTITYKNNTKVNDASVEKTAPTIIVKGKGNYTKQETVTFKILPKNITDSDIVISNPIRKENKKAQKVVPTITRNGKKLVNKKDFTVEYPDTIAGAYKNPGTYNIVIKGKGGYTGQKTITYTITENVLMSSTSVSKIKDQIYTGSTIQPVFTVKSGKTPLVEGTDYKVSYSNNKEIGTATVILTGMGKYSGEKKVPFKIKGVAINKAKISGVPKQMVYTGSAVTSETSGWGTKPTLTISIDGTDKVLTEGTDYTVSYQKNINKGTASIIFTGKNGYSGTLKKTFLIKPYNVFDDLLGKITVTFNENQVYAKGGSKPKPTVKFGSTTLVEGKDYTLSYKNNNKVNDRRDPNKLPIVTIKGKGNYTASISKSFTIVKQSLAKLTITVPDKVYSKTKGAFKSTPKITDLNNKNLSAGTDFEKNYVYTYKNDVTLDNGTVRRAGETVGATDIVPAGTILRVTVSGKGNYADSSVTGEYRITKSSITKASVKVASQTYTGKEITPDKSQITVKIGKQVLTADDYDIVSYSNNIKKGTAKVTIKGKGNYGGTKTVNFTIKSKGFLWWWR